MKTILWLGVTTTWGTVLKGHSTGKVDCSSLLFYLLASGFTWLGLCLSISFLWSHCFLLFWARFPVSSFLRMPTSIVRAHQRIQEKLLPLILNWFRFWVPSLLMSDYICMWMYVCSFDASSNTFPFSGFLGWITDLAKNKKQLYNFAVSSFGNIFLTVGMRGP